MANTNMYPPAWHRVPDSNQERYWDGTRWTDAFRPFEINNLNNYQILWSSNRSDDFRDLLTFSGWLWFLTWNRWNYFCFHFVQEVSAARTLQRSGYGDFGIDMFNNFGCPLDSFHQHNDRSLK